MRTEWASLSVCVGARGGAGWCGVVRGGAAEGGGCLKHRCPSRSFICKGPQRAWGSKGLHLARIELATFSVLG